MSLFHTIDYILFVRPHRLEIYHVYSSQVFTIDFPESILNYEEINNKVEFEKLVNELIHKEKLFKKNAIIVLSDEIVFEKTVTPNEIGKDRKRISTVLEEIPLTDQELGKKIISTKTEIKIWGTNKTIYEEIIMITQSNGWKIAAVVPTNAFSQLKGQKNLHGSQFQIITKDQNYLSQVDFLNDETNTHSGKRSILLPFALIMLVMVSVSFGLYYYKGNERFPLWSTQSRSVSPIAGTTLTPTKPTPIQKPLNLREYKLVILNGSEKKGEAAALKTQLEEKGFVVSQTDNAETSDYQKTLIRAAGTVSKKYLEVLKTTLNLTYIVDDIIATSSAGIDVEVIIGASVR